MRAKDGSEYLPLSVYKNYIHVETLPDRSSPHLCAAYSATHTFFRKLGHQLNVQILDNETLEESLFTYFDTQHIFTYFDTQHIAYQPVPPNPKRANAAGRSIQTFRRHFLSLLATTHPSFPINHWPALLRRPYVYLCLQRYLSRTIRLPLTPNRGGEWPGSERCTLNWLLLECWGICGIDNRSAVIEGKCLGRFAFFPPLANFADFRNDCVLGFGGERVG